MTENYTKTEEIFADYELHYTLSVPRPSSYLILSQLFHMCVFKIEICVLRR